MSNRMEVVSLIDGQEVAQRNWAKRRIAYVGWLPLKVPAVADEDDGNHVKEQ